jgi:hypothetical protein
MMTAKRPTIQVLEKDPARRLAFAGLPIDGVMLPAILLDGGRPVVLEIDGLIMVVRTIGRLQFAKRSLHHQAKYGVCRSAR